jgi:antirestriction protein ArdC
LFHEFAHSTGHEKRLERTKWSAFGSEDYSREELVAEFASAFLCADAGISNDELLTNSTAYIQGWMKALKNDKTLAISAAQQAQKACDFVLGRSFTESEA